VTGARQISDNRSHGRFRTGIFNAQTLP
jgi:hypothetical protein